MVDKSAIESEVSEANLRKSLRELSHTLDARQKTILFRCGPKQSIEENNISEIVEKILIKAEIIPECCNFNDNAVFCATFNPGTEEYFLGVISLKYLDILDSPIYVNPEFCFGVTWKTTDNFLQIVHKDARLTMIYPLTEKFKEEHFEALQTLIEVAEESDSYLVEGN